MTTTPPRIDPRLGAAALRAPAASKEDSRSQAILKFQPRNSFDYRVRYKHHLEIINMYVLVTFLGERDRHTGRDIQVDRLFAGMAIE